ncbi:hypothetical protein [Solemya velum gill symbiont]|uniref:hypothetical protein n=1 Tax=Solemya velum gill symbiont TaxID=2340 RepID=UPI000996ECF1|nr:hypothetical protein [Solemya velum gill symbiont]
MTKKIHFIDKLLYRFTGLLRCRIIRGNHGEPYLERYHLFRLPGGGGAYIHRFLASDPDRGLHDHPWDKAIGMVLAGGYTEERLEENKVVTRSLGPGAINRITATDFHRVVLPHQREAWTFFAHSKKHKDWGFLTNIGNSQESFTPHESVNSEGSHENWWINAARGRNSEREPLQPRQQ